MSDDQLRARVAAHVTDTREQRLAGDGVQARYIRELHARLRTIASLGTVYVEPSSWDSFGAGGPPTIDQYEEVDLAALVGHVPPLTDTPPSASSPSP